MKTSRQFTRCLNVFALALTTVVSEMPVSQAAEITSQNPNQIERPGSRAGAGDEKGQVLRQRSTARAVTGAGGGGGGTGTAATPPWPVRTRPATIAGSTVANLRGSVDARSLNTPMEAYFEWGPTSSLGNEVRSGFAVPAGALPQDYSVAVSGLVPGRLYYFRAVISNGQLTMHGDIVAFQQPCVDLNALPTSIDLVLSAGWHAIANNFHLGNNTLAELLPVLPDPSFAYLHNVSRFDSIYFNGTQWAEPDRTLPPGKGMILSLGAPRTLTFRGDFAAGATCPRPRLPEQWYFVGCPLPKPCNFEEIMGFPPQINDKVYFYRSPIDKSQWQRLFDLEIADRVHTYLVSGWDVEPILEPGRAALVALGPQLLRLSITQTEQLHVNVVGPAGTSLVVEASPSLGEGARWRMFAGMTLPETGSMQVPDNQEATSRFYRGVPVVYANDFEAPFGGEWGTPASVSTSPFGNRKFLGEFGNHLVSLHLSDLPPHTRVSVSFELLILKSWDGNRTDFGPDRLQARVRGGATLFDTTFCNGAPVTQGYPGSLTDNYPARTGADSNNTLGYTFGGDSIYYLTFTFEHSDPSLVLDFLGMNLQEAADESWGLDNVRVDASNAP